jgi:hypothetical protein
MKKKKYIIKKKMKLFTSFKVIGVDNRRGNDRIRILSKAIKGAQSN